MFLLHLSCIHRHFTNWFPCLHLLAGCFPNKELCPHLLSEFWYIVIFAARAALRKQTAYLFVNQVSALAGKGKLSTQPPKCYAHY